jgi:formate dehydrogenase iron-sulfur subunit
MDYEAFAEAGAMVGHGGIVAFDDTVDMARQARFAMEFCAAESCGKCTPCRIGSVRGVEVIDRIIADEDRDSNLVVLQDLCDLMVDGSLCAMGGLTPMPVRSALRHFGEDFERPGVAPPHRPPVELVDRHPAPATTASTAASTTATATATEVTS